MSKTKKGVFDQHFNNSFDFLTIAVNYKNRHPWMTENLRNQIFKKNVKYIKTQKHPEDEVLTKTYLIEKNCLNALLKNTEIGYYSNQLEINQNDISRSWKVLKNIIGKDCSNKMKRLLFVQMI